MSKQFFGVLLGTLLLAAFICLQGNPGLWAEEDFGNQIAQILKNQEKILQHLQEIKTELVRIRVRSN